MPLPSGEVSELLYPIAQSSRPLRLKMDSHQ